MWGIVPVPHITFTIFITSSTRLPVHRPGTSRTRAGVGERDRLCLRMPRGADACRPRHASSPTRSGWGRRVRSATEARSRRRGRREVPEEMGRPPLSTPALGACADRQGAPPPFHVKHAECACARGVAMGRERPRCHAGRDRSAERHPAKRASATASASRGRALTPPSGSRMGRFRLYQRR